MLGILLLDKPRGLSSNGALQRVRRLLGGPKAGHVGSLDPLASGMLPICLGEATKIAADILAGRKRYRFTVKLGERTATGDTEGEIIERAPLPDLSGLSTHLQGFLGRQQQVPPMYSAIKRDGQPLYKLARAGVTVDRAAREIEIHELTLTACEPGSLTLETLCSKGTYVRTLAEDLARALGSVGHVTALRRLAVEPFEGEPLQTLESIEAAGARGVPLLPPERAVAHLPAVSLTPEALARLRQGQAIHLPDAPTAPRLRLHAAGAMVGLGECTAGGNVQPRRMFIP